MSVNPSVLAKINGARSWIRSWAPTWPYPTLRSRIPLCEIGRGAQVTKTTVQVACAAILLSMAGCNHASPSQSTTQMDATVHYFYVAEGFWALRGDDGQAYDPLTFPPDFRKEGLRVHAVFDVLEDRGGTHQVGPIIDIVELVVLACDAAAPCPLPPPPVTLQVVQAGRGIGVVGAVGQIVVRPPGEDAVPAVVCAYDDVTMKSTCALQGSRSGRYEADVTAPGMQQGHAAVDVPARAPLPGECCPVQYVPQVSWLELKPN